MKISLWLAVAFFSIAVGVSRGCDLCGCYVAASAPKLLPSFRLPSALQVVPDYRLRGAVSFHF